MLRNSFQNKEEKGRGMKKQIADSSTPTPTWKPQSGGPKVWLTYHGHEAYVGR